MLPPLPLIETRSPAGQEMFNSSLLSFPKKPRTGLLAARRPRSMKLASASLGNGNSRSRKDS
jgi:hypothetical protein